MLRAFVVAALLGSLFLPGVAAIPHPCEDRPAEPTCRVVVDTTFEAMEAIVDYAMCYVDTAPRYWTTTCV